MFSLDSLNQLQRDIAIDTEGAKLVTAGAGSGKTRLLTHRIAYLIDQLKINPRNILAITFTNKATNEMKERLTHMVPNSFGITIKTFHALCAYILRENIAHLDGFDRYFTVYDSSDQDKLLKKVIKALKLDEKNIKEFDYHISNAKNLGLNSHEYAMEHKYVRDIVTICRVYDEYQRQLKSNNALDFDDLLLKTLELFHINQNVLQYYQHKFQYIHVDEFQDTNLVQYKILKLLADKHRNIFVVGDEDQCIYSWRGANIQNIQDFTKDFDCKIYKLEQNYRSSKSIITVANRLIKYNSARIDKTLFTQNDAGEEVTYYQANDEVDEVEYVSRAIYNLQNRGVTLNNIGILMRVSAMSRLIEEKLLNYNIPYVVSGIFKFFERLEVKNVLSYLNIVVNPKDNTTFSRIINFPRRGIGQVTIDKLTELSETTATPLVELIENARELDVSSAIKQKICDFGDLITDIKDAYKTKSLYDFVDFVITKSQIKDIYNTKSEDDIDRLMNIDQLLQSVKNYEYMNPDANLTDYLESVTLQTSLEKQDDNLPSVSVSTVHASKGLEFDYVFIIGLEEGRFPLSRALDMPDELEEERRLMYVAVTRARQKLYITSAKSRFMYGSRDRQAVSRFVKEMDLVRPSNHQDGFVNNYNTARLGGRGTGDYSSSFGQGGGYASSNSQSYGQQTAQSYGQYSAKSNFVKTGGINELQKLMNNKLDNQQKNTDKYIVGAKVLHTKFGVGTILKVDTSGDNRYVSVDFGKIGVKTLSLNFAPLQLL